MLSCRYRSERSYKKPFTRKDSTVEKKTIYYVSDKEGNDNNAGTSKEYPLRTLAAAEKKKLYPGDEIRLECGSVFSRQALHLNVQGTRQAPIVIGNYGDGSKPVIQCEGTGIWYQNYGQPLDTHTHVWKGYVSSAIFLYDCEYVRVEGLEITNDGLYAGEQYSQGDRLNRTGVSVIAQNRGTLHEIELSDLYIHDVKGNVYDKHLNNGGIYCSALKPKNEKSGIARFDGLFIHDCKVENCSRWGIAAGYTYTHSFFTTLELPDEIVKTYGHERVHIYQNFVKSIGGDGITPMYAFCPLVEYNVAEDTANEINDEIYTEAGERGGKTAAAIWPWKCKNALFQYNEAYHTCDNQDGQAWDADSGDGTVYRYNYSYNNAGGCVMFCEGESVNNEFCYNISMLDGGGVINPAHNPDAHIHHNTFILGNGVPFIRDNMSGGQMLVEQNIICNVDPQVHQEDWYHQIPHAVYRNNLYCNFKNLPDGDTGGILCEEVLLKNPLCGPRTTNGKVHKKEWFEGFVPVKPCTLNSAEDGETKEDFLGRQAKWNIPGACTWEKN